jgi:hypothetical protein
MLVSLAAGAIVLASSLSGVSLSASAGTPEGAGASVSANATAKDVGLPMYPGAKPHKDKDEDSEALNMGAWGGSFGFKIVILDLESSDPPDKIAAFYVAALAKYGRVLNCANSSQKSAGKEDDSSKELTCDDDGKTDAGERVFKSGTKARQHIVSVKPNGSGSLFDLMFLEAHD